MNFNLPNVNIPPPGQPRFYNLRSNAARYPQTPGLPAQSNNMYSSTPHPQNLAQVARRPEVSAIAQAPLITPRRPRELVNRTFVTGQGPAESPSDHSSISSGSDSADNDQEELAARLTQEYGACLPGDVQRDLHHFLRRRLDAENAESSGRATLRYSDLELNTDQSVQHQSSLSPDMMGFGSVPDTRSADQPGTASRTSLEQPVHTIPARGAEINGRYVRSRGTAAGASQSLHVPRRVNADIHFNQTVGIYNDSGQQRRPIIRTARSEDFPPTRPPPTFTSPPPVPGSTDVDPPSVDSNISPPISSNENSTRRVHPNITITRPPRESLSQPALPNRSRANVTNSRPSPLAPFGQTGNSWINRISQDARIIEQASRVNPTLGVGRAGGFNPTTGQGYAESPSRSQAQVDSQASSSQAPATHNSSSTTHTITTSSPTSGVSSGYLPTSSSQPNPHVASHSAQQAPPLPPGPSPAFDWQRMETMFTRALEGVLAKSQREQTSTTVPPAPASNHISRGSVTFTEPVVSHPAPANIPTQVQTMDIAREVARILRAEPGSRPSDANSETDSEGGSTDSYSSASSSSRRSRRHQRSRHSGSSTAHTALTDHDITVLTKQGVSKGVLKERQRQSLNVTKVQELPDIPPTQFVVQMSADSVPKFSGQMEDYESFKELFLAFAQALPVSQRLVNLKLKLDPNSINAIAGCIGQDKASFENAFEILDRKNNKKDLLINILISKIDAYFEYDYENDDQFIDMVSKVQSLHNRILSIDPLQLTTLNGLTTRFTRCLPDKPYSRVSNLMGKFTDEGVSKYNFQKVLKVCEKHVEWLTNQSANLRASRRRKGSSQTRHQFNPNQQAKGNLAKERYSQNFGQRRGQAVYTTSASQEPDVSQPLEPGGEFEPDQVDHVAAADARESASDYKPDSHSRGRSRQRQGNVDTANPPRSGRSRSRSRMRKSGCTLCSATDHIPRDCKAPPANLLEFVDSNRLCRICLLAGHYAHECPVLLYCPADAVICKTSDCDSRPHAVTLCNDLKKK